jgi:hypothetical protein
MKKLLLACVLLAASPLALAQVTEPSVTMGASVTNANGILSTTITWSTNPVANSCTASGHASWTGQKAGSGTLQLPDITLSGTYTLSLNCTWPGDTTATVSWTPPTQNTDGSALAKCASQTVTGSDCLLNFRVIKSDTQAGANEVSQLVDNRNATSYAWTGLPVGTHWFTVVARNARPVESDVALPRVSKTITGSQVKTAGITLTVNPKPNAPVITSVQ